MLNLSRAREILGPDVLIKDEDLNELLNRIHYAAVFAMDYLTAEKKNGEENDK
jgi:predicted ribosome quality control (RQC) complex YloA/Tae2 family protein